MRMHINGLAFDCRRKTHITLFEAGKRTSESSSEGSTTRLHGITPLLLHSNRQMMHQLVSLVGISHFLLHHGIVNACEAYKAVAAKGHVEAEDFSSEVIPSLSKTQQLFNTNET